MPSAKDQTNIQRHFPIRAPLCEVERKNNAVKFDSWQEAKLRGQAPPPRDPAEEGRRATPGGVASQRAAGAAARAEAWAQQRQLGVKTPKGQHRGPRTGRGGEGRLGNGSPDPGEAPGLLAELKPG